MKSSNTIVWYWFWKSIVFVIELIVLFSGSFSIMDIIGFCVSLGFIGGACYFGICLLIHKQVIWYRNHIDMERTRLSEPIVFLLIDSLSCIVIVSLFVILARDKNIILALGIFIMIPICVGWIIAYRHYWIKYFKNTYSSFYKNNHHGKSNH
ncbi:MAG: hypothetical protein DI598_06795 [Pseudopedobacter saltans]|uniref:Uncharacterized protein n=1 Tax=Pseudopedobacter saltans TaxID=151895 RepID=A0A2W5F6K7_9SPHI|nr:MAG: hypothetical protein DI598_06795 [Pseudopedobacter saltans]